MALEGDSSKAISYGIPKECSFEEIDEVGHDGRVQTNEFETYVQWKLSGKAETLAKARQKGYGHALLPLPPEEIEEVDGSMHQNPAFKAITFEQNDVARTYLSSRFTGREISQSVANMMAQNWNANDMFAEIDRRYSMRESLTDPEAIKRRSRQALQSLQSAAPMRYSITAHAPIEWEGIGVTEHTNIRKWMRALQDEAGAHDNLLQHIDDQLQPCDRERVATTERMLEKLQSHPHLAFPYVESEKATWLDRCKVFDGNTAVVFDPAGNYPPGKQPGYVATFNYIYEKHAQMQLRLDEKAKAVGVVAAIPTTNACMDERAPRRKLPPNACPWYFYGRGNCKHGDQCPKSHDGIKGSGGPWKSRKQREAERASKGQQKSQSAVKTPQLKGYKRKRRCFACDQEGHIAANCTLKQRLLAGDTSETPRGTKIQKLSDTPWSSEQLQVLGKQLVNAIQNGMRQGPKKRTKSKGSEIDEAILDSEEEQELSTTKNAKRINTICGDDDFSGKLYTKTKMSDMIDRDGVQNVKKRVETHLTMEFSALQISKTFSIEQPMERVVVDVTKLHEEKECDAESTVLNMNHLYDSRDESIISQEKTIQYPKNETHEQCYLRIIMDQTDEKRMIGVLHKRVVAATPTTNVERKRHRAMTTLPCFDSGASVHATGQREQFCEIRELKTPLLVFDAAASTHKVTHVGTIKFLARDVHNLEKIVTFKGVQYTPTLSGLYIDTTRLRQKDGWRCNGTPQGVVWTNPQHSSFRLKIVDGNEYLVGRCISKAEESTKRVNGLVAQSFLERIDKMPLEELNDMVEKDQSLTKWELHESRMRLARAGRYVFTSERDPLLALHHALGHVNWRVVAKHAKKHKIPLSNVANAFCEACCKAKHKKAPRGKPNIKTKVKFLPPPYTQWSADVFGPVKSCKHNMIEYQLVFLDRGSNTIKSYALRHLRDIPERVAQWIHEIRDDLTTMRVDEVKVEATPMLKLRTDSASYFQSAKMQEVLRREKVKISFSPPYTQSRNAFVERSIAVLANMTKALLKASGLKSELYWADAWTHAVKIRDLLPRNANPGCKSPYEIRSGLPPKDPAALYHPFGQKCMVYIPEDQRARVGKMHHDRSRVGRIIGHDAETDTAKIVVMTSQGHRPLVLPSAQYKVDKQLPPSVFNKETIVLPHEENKYYCEWRPQKLKANASSTTKDSPGEKMATQQARETDMETETHAVTDRELLEQQTTESPVHMGEMEVTVQSEGQEEQYSPEEVRDEALLVEPYGKRGGKSRYWVVEKDHPAYKDSIGINQEQQTTEEVRDEALLVEPYGPSGAKSKYSVIGYDDPEYKDSVGVVNGIQRGDPKAYSLKQATMLHPEYIDHLIKAAEVEVRGLIQKCLVPIKWSDLRQGDKVFRLISLYTIKTESGQFEKAKCRCCFPGQNEIMGIEYLMTATNMPALSTLRVFMALQPFENEVCSRADIAQAFLRAELEPLPANERRYVQFPRDISPKDEMGRPRVYQAHKGIYGMHSAGRMWQEMLFKSLKLFGLEQNPYDKALFTSENLRVLVWTDDLVVRATRERSEWLRKTLEKEYGDVRWKNLDYVLGLDVVRSPEGWLGIHSGSYVKDMIQREGLTKAKPKTTPIPATVKLTKHDRADEINLPLKHAYQRVLGQLSYLATWTRLDLSYPVSAMGKVAHAPQEYHMKLARRVMAYCKKEPTLGLRWSHPADDKLLNKLVVYSDASWAQEEGYCSQSGYVAVLNGAPVHWISTKQDFPALSSTEAEVMAAETALRHTLYLKRLLESLGMIQGVVIMHMDAENAIRFCTSEKVSRRNHHIGAKYMRIRYHVDRDIQLVFVRTTEMLADICTKNAEKEQFERMVSGMMTMFPDTANAEEESGLTPAHSSFPREGGRDGW